jgi:hypothetical protein
MTKHMKRNKKVILGNLSDIEKLKEAIDDLNRKLRSTKPGDVLCEGIRVGTYRKKSKL